MLKTIARTKYVLLLAIPLASWAFFGVSFAHETDYHPHGGLLTESRSELVVCASSETREVATTDALAQALTAALDRASKSRADWDEKFGHRFEVQRGCTDAPSQPREGLTTRELKKGAQVDGPGAVATPSQYRAVVVALSEETARQRLGELPIGRSAFELSCRGNECWEVTTIIWVPSSAIGDALQMDAAIEEALGLEEVPAGAAG